MARELQPTTRQDREQEHHVIPDIKDPRWRALVCGTRPVQFVNLTTRIIFTRVKVLALRKDEGSVQQAISTMHDYFSKNEAAAAQDLKLVFS